MSPSAPRLILHLGQHKTGSKALQSFLFRHARRLRALAILYPPAGAPPPTIPAYTRSHFFGYAVLRGEALRALGQTVAADDWERRHAQPSGKLPPLQAWLGELETRRRACGARTLVLSAEDLFDMHTAHELDFDPDLAPASASLLAEACRRLGWQPQLAVYLRRQDHLLAAHYAQFIKGAASPTPDWDAFAAAFAPRLDSHALLAPWLRAFDAAPLILRPYELAALPGGIVPDFFHASLGMTLPPTWTPPPANRPCANRTPGRDHLEFIRLLRQGRRPEWGGLEPIDVLDAALQVPAPRDLAAAWMSPTQRRALLEAHASGNDALARQAGHTPPFFSEPPPDAQSPWTPYPGLGEEAAQAIAQCARAARRRRHSWPLRLTRGFYP